MRKGIVKHLTTLSLIYLFLVVLVLILFVESTNIMTFLLLMIVPFAILVIYTLSYIKRQVIQPLEYVKKEVSRIGDGDLSNPISTNAKDEIGELFTSFDQMRVKLYEQQKKQEQFEIERKVFIDSISHDLKTPLSSISAYVEALQDGIVSNPKEEGEYLEVIMNKVNALNELSNELSMSYETPDTLRLVYNEVDCFVWARDFLDNLKMEYESKSIHCNYRNTIIMENQCYMNVDIHQLNRALFNITSNATRYYKEYFTISIEIIEENLIICIENDGVSLDEENVERIFQRFYSEDSLNDQGHLGLGLYITRTIINSMDGNVNATLQDGIIQFRITLPISIN